jgi:hypothetical protein
MVSGYYATASIPAGCKGLNSQQPHRVTVKAGDGLAATAQVLWLSRRAGSEDDLSSPGS